MVTVIYVSTNGELLVDKLLLAKKLVTIAKHLVVALDPTSSIQRINDALADEDWDEAFYGIVDLLELNAHNPTPIKVPTKTPPKILRQILRLQKNGFVIQREEQQEKMVSPPEQKQEMTPKIVHPSPIPEITQKPSPAPQPKRAAKNVNPNQQELFPM